MLFRSLNHMGVVPSEDSRQCKPIIRIAETGLGWAPKANLEGGLKPTITYFKRVVLC